MKPKTLINPIVVFLTLTLMTNCSEHHSSWTVLNEEKTLSLTLKLDEGKISYTLSSLDADESETLLVEKSPMGLVRADADFTSGFSFKKKTEPVTFDETYTMSCGKQLAIQNKGVEQAFQFSNADGDPFRIIVRGYNDAMAFRYSFPESGAGQYKIVDETTGFKIAQEGIAWMHPYMKVDTWAPSYESIWENAIETGTAAPDTVGWAFPVVFNTNDHWLMITEAGMDRNYFGLHLNQYAEEGLYSVRLPETNETYGVAPQEAIISLPWKSPWKVFVAGSTPAAIQETNIVTNLSEPNAIGDFSWVKPGRVSWSWWSDPASPDKYDRLIPFIDLSAELGWEYSLIDLGWHKMGSGGDILKLIDYANTKDVGLILWYNSGGKHNQVSDACPCDLMTERETRRAEMKRISEWGIKGIKVDFMQSDKQYIMNLYQDILEDAADFKLFVDFHGATIPRGWQRTYPNLLTLEGIRGAEQYWDTVMAENAHTYHTIYTFTRNVLGSMDYTPVLFSFPEGKVPHRTTNAHELATSVAFESGLQHFADDAKGYLSQPEYVLDFLRAVPVAWDETLYIAGIPGKYNIMARRRDNKWFIAGINGLSEKKTVTFSLNFLEGSKQPITIIKDGEDPQSFLTEKIMASNSDSLTLNMASRGGFVAYITDN